MEVSSTGWGRVFVCCTRPGRSQMRLGRPEWMVSGLGSGERSCCMSDDVTVSRCSITCVSSRSGGGFTACLLCSSSFQGWALDLNTPTPV